jgi:hypothetical protein
MNLHHFNGEAMPDVSTRHATLFAPDTVYIREIVVQFSPWEQTLIFSDSPGPPDSSLMARQRNSSDWLYLNLAL